MISFHAIDPSDRILAAKDTLLVPLLGVSVRHTVSGERLRRTRHQGMTGIVSIQKRRIKAGGNTGIGTTRGKSDVPIMH